MDVLKKFIVKNSFILIAVLISIVSSHSLFHGGLIPTHDGEYHVIRFYEFNNALRDGNFYPRWAPHLNNGFGVPLFNFVYPLPNYVASLFHFLGFSFIDSFKLNLILASILGAFFMYLWVREFWGTLGGLVSSAFYTFSPYHFVDIFIRGSIGEVWALALFPGYLWSITKFIKERNKKFAILSSVFLALIIFSHNILALMFFPFVISYIAFLISQEKKQRYLILNTFYSTLLGLGLSSIFWLPALFEKQFVRGLEIYDFSKNFPEVYQLIFPSWGSGFAGDQNQLSLQVGIANLIAFVGSIFLLFRNSKYKKFIIFFQIFFLLVFFLMTRFSLTIWHNIPLFNYFQFPWRFLSLEILFASFLSGSLINFFKPSLTSILLITFTILLGFGYTNVAYYLERNDSYYTTRPNFILGTNSPGNSFNTFWFRNMDKRIKKLSLESEEIVKEKIRTSSYLIQAKVSSSKTVTVNTAYFPGWTVYVDGRKKSLRTTENGLFAFDLEKGKYDIGIRFEDTSIRKLAYFLSLISLFLVLLRFPFFATIKR